MRLTFYFGFIQFLFWGIAFGHHAVGQEQNLVKGIVQQKDTLAHVELQEVVVMPRRKFSNQQEYFRYSRLVRNIKITLPYARLAATKLREIDQTVSTFQSEKERKAYLKKAEKALFEEFEKPLRRLTISQGRLLIKLIDRETGQTSFTLIQQYKGKFNAFLWQSVARMFGSNLKDEFDSVGDDKTIDYIIVLIDNGVL